MSWPNKFTDPEDVVFFGRQVTVITVRHRLETPGSRSEADRGVPSVTSGRLSVLKPSSLPLVIRFTSESISDTRDNVPLTKEFNFV